METCSACGYDIIPGDSFCTSCGARYAPAPAQIHPDAGDRAGAASAVDSQPAVTDLREPPTDTRTERPDLTVSQDQQGQSASSWRTQPMPGADYAPYESPGQPLGQFSAGSFAPPGDGTAAIRTAPALQAVADVRRVPAPAGLSVPPATVCPSCSQAWTGSQSCGFCGQVWGLPNGIVLSSAGRRFGGYLLEGLLVVCTLVIGWFIWTLIVWAQGQTPAKQLLGMRVVRLDTRAYAGWGRMFLRDFVGKGIVWLVGVALFAIGAVIADCWLLWDKDKQELWDKLAGTVVVNDPDKQLAPVARLA